MFCPLPHPICQLKALLGHDISSDFFGMFYLFWIGWRKTRLKCGQRGNKSLPGIQLDMFLMPLIKLKLEQKQTLCCCFLFYSSDFQRPLPCKLLMLFSASGVEPFPRK